jgi:hypothetical protein
MKSIEEVFEHYSKEYAVRDDFEDRVYAKIKKKESVRKVKYSSLLVFSLCLILYLVISFFPFSKGKENRETRYAGQFSEAAGTTAVKEEVPVMENVFFASFDDSTDYAIEQVVLTEEEEGI